MNTGITLIVMRHAKSSWLTGCADIDRPLCERGLRDALAAGAVLAEFAIDQVWCSSALRAQQTWEQACLGGASAERTLVDKSLYDTWADELITDLATLDEEGTVLIVGHQPTLGDLVTTLAKPSPLRAQAATHYPTAGIAVLRHPGPWETLGPGSATLERFEAPRDPDRR